MKKIFFISALAAMAMPFNLALAQTSAAASDGTVPTPAMQAPAPVGGTPAQDPAPAATNDDWMKYKDPYSGEENNIANPHRTNDEILAWASRAVAEAISFHAGTFDDEIKSAKRYFVQDGWKGYTQFLQDSKLLGVARSGKYSVSSAADGDPMMLGNGAVGGAYQWQIEVPIITSVTQPDDKGEPQTMSGSRMKIQITMSRVPEGAGGDDGMAIVNWKLSPPAQ